MNHLIKNVIIFLSLFCIINFLCVLILKSITPPYLENKIYSIKYSYYLKNQIKFNTLFFGSSLTYRQINPYIIDNNLKELKIKSFNFGAPATLNPEALFLFEDFLEKKSSKTAIKYAFVELSELIPIADENTFSPRSYYYLNFKFLMFVLKYYVSSNEYNFKTKIKVSYLFLQGYFLNNILLFYPPKEKAESCYLGENKDGYYSLDNDLKKNRTKDLLDRNIKFLKDTSVIAIRELAKTKHNSKKAINSSFLKFLNNLILKSEKHNIKLYFIIPPRIGNQVILSYLKNNINDNRVINLNDYAKYPKLYLSKYSFDATHLNSIGASIYSNYLANEIRIKFATINLNQIR